MSMTAGHIILLLMVLGLFLVLFLTLLKFFKGEWKNNATVEKQDLQSTAISALLQETTKAFLQKYPHIPIEQRNAITDIIAELKYLFSRNKIDQEIALDRILKWLHDFDMQGQEFTELHQLIRSVLQENKLGHMAGEFENMCSCRQSEKNEEALWRS